MVMLLGVALAAAAMALPRKLARPPSDEAAADDRRYAGEGGVAADRAAATAPPRRPQRGLGRAPPHRMGARPRGARRGLGGVRRRRSRRPAHRRGACLPADEPAPQARRE